MTIEVTEAQRRAPLKEAREIAEKAQAQGRSE